MSVEKLIRQTIQNEGYITIDKMMSMALSSNKSSYYRSKQPLGSEADFITAPEVSQMFGEMIGIWAISVWERLKRPNQINLIEFGPGRGFLMRDLLKATSSIPEFHKAINITLLEINPLLIEEQKKNLDNFNIKISHSNVEEYYNNKLNDFPSIIIANEFFDALEVKQYIKVQNGWNEIVIDLDSNNNFKFNNIDSEFRADFDDNLKEGSILEISAKSLDIMHNISKDLYENKGAAIIIDYGYDISPSLRKEGQYNSTLQGIKGHKFCDVLSKLGEVDLSCHVDFDALKTVAKKHELSVFGSITQSDLLNKLGINIRLDSLISYNPNMKDVLLRQYNRLTSKDQMGELFKAIIIES